jgi:hypothetical protein
LVTPSAEKKKKKEVHSIMLDCVKLKHNVKQKSADGCIEPVLQARMFTRLPYRVERKAKASRAV